MTDSEQENGRPDFAQQAEQFGRMWSEFAAKMAASGAAFTPGATPPEAARQMRDAALASMAQGCDQFIRSPAFIEAMKQSIDNAITWRRQWNDMMRDLRHEMQGVARDDVDHLMVGLRHMETRLLDRLEEVERRVEKLNARLERMENQAPAATPSAGRAKSTGTKPGAAAPSKRTKKKTTRKKKGGR